MSRLIAAAVAAAALATPSFAAAGHVPGGEYSGEVVTAQGGTVGLAVSEDGDDVSAEFAGMGSANGMCTGVGFSTGPTPLEGHAFDYLSPNGQVSASGTFTKSMASGSAQVLLDPCTTGSQSWRVVGPDAFFAEDDLGLDVYDHRGEGQTVKESTKRGDASTFVVRVTNQGMDAQTLVLEGCDSSKGFKVKWRDELGDNVTEQITDGDYDTPTLQPQAAGDASFQLEVKVQSSAKPGKTKSCALEARSLLQVDTIKAKVKAKR